MALAEYCVNDGASNATWPITFANGSTAAGVCHTGYYGSPTRNCSQSGGNGTWSIVSNPCTGIILCSFRLNMRFKEAIFLLFS